MESGYKLELENPVKKAGCFSRLTFLWMIKLFRAGTKRGLEISDLYKALEGDESEKLGDKLENHWKNDCTVSKVKKCGPSLAKCMLKSFGVEYMLWGLMMCAQMMLKVVTPIILSILIKLFADRNKTEHVANIYLATAALVLVPLLHIFMTHHSNFAMGRVGMRIRVAVSSLVYRKILKLNQNVIGNTTTGGHIVNLLSNDVSRYDLVVLTLHAFWIMPLQAAVVTYCVWREVGVSCAAGIISMIMFSLPVQGYLAKLTGKLRQKIAVKTDKRVRMMSEIVSGIQVIKMYAWEKPFERLIHQARKSEVRDLTKTSYLRGFYSSCMVFLERLSLCLTVTCYVLLGNVPTADIVFSMAQFFNILQLAMAVYYPMAVTFGAEAWVSTNRLQEFLMLNEKEESHVEIREGGGVGMSEVWAYWIKGVPTLKQITANIPPGSLCAIVGSVGAGKSSVLQLLLGELPPKSGKVTIGGEISYASQKPWLFSSTVRNNILFGQEYNKRKYKKVVKVCALEKDFEQFPYGDKTVVGDRGASLSGGQRARINLARAVYRQADIYLLDDPLSAVDAHVGKHLFNECIYRYLKGSTRILVTHQVQHIKKADIVIVMSGGEIEAIGTYRELSNKKLDFARLLSEDGKEKKEDDVAVDENSIDENGDFFRRASSISLASSTISSMSDSLPVVQSNKENEEESFPHMETSPLKEYFKSSKSTCLIILLIVMMVGAQAVCSGSDFWVALWTSQEEIRHANDSRLLIQSDQEPSYETVEVYNIAKEDMPYYTYKKLKQPSVRVSNFTLNSIFEEVEHHDRIYTLFRTDIAMYVYGSLIACAVVLTITRSLLFFKICMLSSVNLHKKMFNALLKAPMIFFNTNPSGRILNRFSKDMGAIDEILPKVILEATQIMLVMCGILVNVTVANNYAVIAIVILGLAFLKVRSLYIATAKDIKHLEGVSKSPVFSHISSTLNGLVTIRSSKIEDVLIREFDQHQDVHTSAWYLTLKCVVSFGLWLDLLCVVFIGCVAFSFVILHTLTDSINGSLVGLAISQALVLTGMLQHGMRQTTEVVNQLTSVERVLQYTTIETEQDFDTPKDKQPVGVWPSKGMIEFRHLYLKYTADEPHVLRDLDFTIYPAEKIGIVGRTGAGKSSLISALFRLAPLEGAIYIDGVDTQTVGLSNLRRKISIIPQEPVLFSNTLRYNLDPFGEFDDARLWKALEEVELKQQIPSLDHMVSEGGNNFSIGQRQLICLARAIVRNNKILVMDEATANVDQRTDSFIQETIRRRFKDCTVLTIAHRLNTIMDSDKVMVLSSGCMLEYDHPHKLLQIPEGHFHKMVLETGPQMAMQLKDVAMEAYTNKFCK